MCACVCVCGSMGVGAALYIYSAVVKKVHVRYLMSFLSHSMCIKIPLYNFSGNVFPGNVCLGNREWSVNKPTNRVRVRVCVCVCLWYCHVLSICLVAVTYVVRHASHIVACHFLSSSSHSVVDVLSLAPDLHAVIPLFTLCVISFTQYTVYSIPVPQLSKLWVATFAPQNCPFISGYLDVI